jgi:hypothetical protein
MHLNGLYMTLHIQVECFPYRYTVPDWCFHTMRCGIRFKFGTTDGFGRTPLQDEDTDHQDDN